MKSSISFLFVFALAYVSIGQVRNDQRINFDWKFIQQPIENAEKIEFDDKGWETVHLPHDASIYGAFLNDSLNSDRKNGFRPRLSGWYRKDLVLETIEEGKLYFLYFEGVYRDAKVYLNGKQVARQLNGYEGFEIDITSNLKEGSNVLAVSYDNTDMESSRWYNGEGIYRDVWFKKRPKTFIINDGEYVTTPSISEEKADVQIQVEVQNTDSAVAMVTLQSEILDEKGSLVANTKAIVPIPSGDTYTFRNYTEIKNPVLWDIDNPYLYTLKTTILVDGESIDESETPFGVRTLKFDPNTGFSLNGKKVLLKGVNIHHDLGPLGAASFERGFERRLEGLQKLGCNAIRLAHNPHDEYILDWCDQNGMLVFDEAFDKWSSQFFGAGNEFEDYWKSSLTSFIRRDRNHPSVILWSVGNETKQQRSPKANFGIDQMKEMADFVHKLEPSRMVTCGLHPSRARGSYRTENYYREGPPEMEFYMDVVSTNYREEFWPIDRKNHPQLSFILSEAQVGNLGNEWFNFNHDYGIGLFYWGGTDYIGESFGWPAKGWPNGIIDWNDHWKPFSYYIQSLYSEEPMVQIAAYDESEETQKYWNEVNLRFQPMYSHWNWAGKDSVKILTMTNCQEVELLVNGTSVGKKQVPEEYYTKDIKSYTAEEYDPDNPINTGPAIHKELEWTVPYESGEIVAVARNDGKIVAEHKIKTAGKAYAVVLKPDRNEISADGLDLSYITVEVVDEQGNIVPDADHEITFSVKGAGTNAGVGNADIISHEPFQGNTRKVFQGKALLIVRSTRNAGKISISAKSKGLKSAKVQVISKQP